MQDVRVTSAAPAAPSNPLAAVTHPDPYPYYDDLARQPLWHDDELGLWVASSSADVEAVFHHPAGRVRPPGEPVPAHLVGTAAGEVFGRLVRMTDGVGTAALKARLIKLLGGMHPEAIEAAAEQTRADLDRENGDRVAERWLDVFPTGVVARLLGVESLPLADLVDAARALARCFAPGATPDTAVAGAAAAAQLDQAAGLLPLVASAFGTAPTDDVTANLAGMFFQTFDATAGLIGNTLVGLAREPHPIDSAIEHTLRLDPAVHNTRRFFVEATTIGTATIGAGEAVLLVLAAANRDARSANLWSFGSGAHRCPAPSLAPMIAGLAVDALASTSPGEPVGYRPSSNARIPRWR